MPARDFEPRYYALFGINDTDPDTYFRILSGGVYETWDRHTKTWQHVTSPILRDFYSRAIENGDNVIEVAASRVQ